MSLIWIILFIGIFIISLVISSVIENEFIFFTSLAMIVLLLFIVFLQRPKTIDLTKDEFYKITNIEFEDGNIKQICILKDGRTKNIYDIVKIIYPEGSVVRRYKYKSKEKYIDFKGLQNYYYEVITPNDKKYQEAKEKVIKIKITGE